VKTIVNRSEPFKEIIQQEEKRIGDIVGEMRATLAAEKEDRESKDQELVELKRQKLDAIGWREKRELDAVIERCRQRYGMRQFQDASVLNQPYFGILELDDDALGALSTCLGRQSFFARNGKALVIDWREAPLSRLYYEYDAGEFYEEEIKGRERSGVVRSKRQVDTTGGELHQIVAQGMVLLRGEGGSWQRIDDGGPTAVSRKEEQADHRLPEITALISGNQFRTITHPESRTVLLQGGAGSGKTTVGLHRIAYLAYQDPARFQPQRILVVMFNRSLQHYISRVLPELGIRAGVVVETYHSWAGKLFRAGRIPISYRSDTVPASILRIKKHPRMLELVDQYLARLMNKSRAWFLKQLDQAGDPDLGLIQAHLDTVTHLGDFLNALATPTDTTEIAPSEHQRRLRSRLIRRLHDHVLDLNALLCDRELLEESFEKALSVDEKTLNELIQWQTKPRNRNQVDFADTGILLWIMQRKRIAAARPGYAHVMVDEAQDLSEVELATLLYAADDHQSITICGDMAQKIKGDVSFDSPEGFAGFIRTQQRRTGTSGLCADTLEVGYRATRPIMELAWQVLGEKPSMAVPRDGEPVPVILTTSHQETMAKAKDLLEKYQGERPKALVAVVARYKAEANRVFEDLTALGLLNVRRHERDDFSFQPGIIVTNAHQVKGLEFSAVLVINPSTSRFRDNRDDRMLLHVLLTRASDHLWIVGHQPMAYGLGQWCEK
jgi:DNA helicase II / ATP-dependent DNA helicase PcrA